MKNREIGFYLKSHFDILIINNLYIINYHDTIDDYYRLYFVIFIIEIDHSVMQIPEVVRRY